MPTFFLFRRSSNAAKRTRDDAGAQVHWGSEAGLGVRVHAAAHPPPGLQHHHLHSLALQVSRGPRGGGVAASER